VSLRSSDNGGVSQRGCSEGLLNHRGRFGREAAVYSSGMTHEEAQAECVRLAAESPDRTTHQWLPKEEPDGSWSVVKVNIPPTKQQELTAETEAAERPPTPDDPRPSQWRNAPYGNA
jgi:hypothetical protein